MCSIGEDDFGDEGGLHGMLPTGNIPTDETPVVCKKCNLQSAIVKLNFKDAQCEQCFLTYIRHKFRANLGITKIVSRFAKVVVIYDGKESTSVLLHLVHYATTQGQFKRLQLNPSILFIDDSCLYDLQPDQRRAHITEVQQLLRQFDIPAFYTSLASVDSVPLPIDTVSQLDEAQLLSEQKFIASMAAIGSLSSRQDYVHCVRAKVMRKVADHLQCPFVFTSEICPDLAIKLLSNIALGRGSSVAQDVSFCDPRSSAVQIVRPIRDFDAVEVETYVKVHSIRVLESAKLYGADADEFASIQNLTKGFVEDLQLNFQSTVSTVFRTGSKIATAAVDVGVREGNIARKCMMCMSQLDTSDSTTLLAIEFSRCTSLQAGQCDGGIMVDQNDDDNRNAKFLQNLCHGCNNIFRDLNEDSNVLDYM